MTDIDNRKRDDNPSRISESVESTADETGQSLSVGEKAKRFASSAASFVEGNWRPQL